MDKIKNWSGNRVISQKILLVLQSRCHFYGININKILNFGDVWDGLLRHQKLQDFIVQEETATALIAPLLMHLWMLYPKSLKTNSKFKFSAMLTQRFGLWSSQGIAMKLLWTSSNRFREFFSALYHHPSAVISVRKRLLALSTIYKWAIASYSMYAW